MTFIASIDDIVAKSKTLGKKKHWNRIRLKEIATIVNGYPFESSKFNKDTGFPLLRIRDILPGETKTFYNGKYDKTYIVNEGDLVVGMDGDFNCSLWKGQPVLLNQRVCKIVPDESRYLKKFMAYVLPSYLKAINDNTPSLTVKHLSSLTISTIPLPYPTIKEQEEIIKEIETQFTRLDAGVAALKRAKANLKRYRAAVLKAACEGKLVPTEAENGILKGWRSLTLDDFKAKQPNSIRRGPFGSAIKKEFFVPSGYKVYEQKNAIYNDFERGDYYISKEKYSELKAFEVKPGDLIISCSGTIGRIAEAPDWAKPGIINQALLKLTLDQNIVLNDFFKMAFTNMVNRIIAESVRGSAMQNITGIKDLKKIEFHIPPFDEQKLIIEEVERRLSLIGDIENIINTNDNRSANLRSAILAKSLF